MPDQPATDDLAARLANLTDEHADICGCTVEDQRCPVPWLIADLTAARAEIELLRGQVHATQEIDRRAAAYAAERARADTATAALGRVRSLLYRDNPYIAHQQCIHHDELFAALDGGVS